MAIDKDYIGFDPLVWVDRLQDVAAESQFSATERDIIKQHLQGLRTVLSSVARRRRAAESV